MTRRRSYLILSAAALASLAFTFPASAANLLTNPGFEAPDTGKETPPAAWTTVGDVLREPFDLAQDGSNGKYDMWFQTFQTGQETLYQDFGNGIQPGTDYTLNASFYFEPNFATINGTLDYGLVFYDTGGNSVGQNFTTYTASQITTTGAWTTYSITGTAPANTNSIEVEFDFLGQGASGGGLAWLVDNVDLEGAGSAPSGNVWALSGGGDWNVQGNWTSGSAPNAIGAEADFLSSPVGITAAHTVFADTPVVVGTMLFNNPNTYVIAGAAGANGGPGLTLQTTTGNAQVIVQQGTQEINLPTLLASNTTFNVSSGSALVIADPLTIAAGKTLNQTGGGTVTYESTITVGSGASFALGNSTHAHALTLQANASASITGKNNILTLDSLSLDPSAVLNVGANETDLNYAGASPAAAIRADLLAKSITSSASAAQAGTAVGYVDTGSVVRVKYTWLGDLNLDGTVNASDLSHFALSGTNWSQGDLNYDGVVNGDDYALFMLGSSMAGSRNISAVPEPAAASLLVLAGLLPLRRRRRSA